MTKSELIKNIDSKTYIENCKKANKYASKTGIQTNGEKCFESDIPHDISFELWDLDIPIDQIISIFFELYEDMPCYAYLMYLAMEFKNFSKNEKNLVIDKFYQYLSVDDPTLSKPIEYSLWCDYFEDDKLSGLVWNRLLNNEDINDLVIKKILEVSGPVDFSIKETLYKKIIHCKNLHISIFKSIQYSQFDYFGKIEKDKARGFINLIDIDKTTLEYKELLSNL